MEGWTVVRCPTTKFLAQMGYHIFLPMMLRARNLGARSPAKIEKGLFALLKVANFNLKKFALLFQLPYFIGLQSTVYPYMVKGADFFHFLNLPNFTGKAVMIVNVSIHPSLNRSFLCSSVCLFGFLFLSFSFSRFFYKYRVGCAVI